MRQVEHIMRAEEDACYIPVRLPLAPNLTRLRAEWPSVLYSYFFLLSLNLPYWFREGICRSGAACRLNLAVMLNTPEDSRAF